MIASGRRTRHACRYHKSL